MPAAVCLLALLAVTAAGQDRSGGQDAAGERPLQFRTETGDVARAGHATLAWWPHPEADAYRLHDDDQNVVYRGRFAQAFVSGLPDGEHRFWVSAIDVQGNVIAEGPQPAVVVVQHWPARLAWGLFSLGAVVVGVLVAVLISGAIHTRRDPERIDRSSEGVAG